MDIVEHYRNQSPILDRNDEFMFFSNNKVAQTSINRHLLRGRVIVKKDDPDKYARAFDAAVSSFDSLYKFTIVRNPWDRVVSAFFYLKKHPKKLPQSIKSTSFDHFILNILSKHGSGFDPHFDFQHPKAFFHGGCFVDFIGRIENIESDWDVIAKAISAPAKVPHKNKSSHKYYRGYYTPETIKVIEEVYAHDIELLGYGF